ASTFTGGLIVNGGTVTDTTTNGLGAGAVVANAGGQVTLAANGTATTVTSFTTKPGGTVLVDDSAPAVTLGANVVTNPGFETGDVSGWTTFASSNNGAIPPVPAASTVQAHTGTYSALLGNLSGIE